MLQGLGCYLIFLEMFSFKEYLRHSILFVLTLVTTTLAGGEWVYGKSIMVSGDSALTWEYFFKSMAFSIPFIGILLIHELGHFFTSLYHKVRCTLPFFIPAWLGFIGAPSIGTFGAIIQMRGFVNSRVKFFDIGIAGPLAGFVVALGVLIYGLPICPRQITSTKSILSTLTPIFKDMARMCWILSWEEIFCLS